ncbi:Beta-lactamase-like [Syntrophomonas zehnderi OL-4]|uniref:Beta-lactamase-like n=1 Tax=Syntrophomonas zehnderi OL-4 TaxID=690567 RepID=A0A0E4GA13_9FIRM|nr:MBL fold metallo-hydrolase [Syntrophomonas zehnderi]CFX18288.1 Beta-lactamase-like [Syntrophomonas zehnderi OL-4]
MQLNHITGNSYYLDGDSAIGVYVFADNTCLLVDSGPGEGRAKKVLDVLEQEGLQVHAIFCTHAHADHCGGNAYIQKQTGCRIMASPIAAAIIENPLIGPAMLYSAYPLRILTSRALMMHPSRVDQIIHPGPLYIKNEEFTVLDLPGHSIGQIGIINPDEIAFLGDTLMHEKMLADYPFLYMVDINSQLQTLVNIQEKGWPQVFLTHGGLLDDFKANIKKNQERIDHIMTVILTFLKNSSTREQVTAHVIKEFNLTINSGQYFLIFSTVSAFLSYLCHQKQAQTRVEDGIMKYIRIEK